jgi:hypothetical protein
LIVDSCELSFARGVVTTLAGSGCWWLIWWQSEVDARHKMAVSLSSQLMTFNDNEFDNQISRMDEVEDLSTCSVCFSEYNSDKRIAKFLPCFHTFCLECLRVIILLTFKYCIF